jgi:amidase
MAGPDGYDTLQHGTRIEFASRLDQGLDGIRIGLLDETIRAAVEDDVADAIEEAAEVLRREGATIERVSLPFHLDAMALAAPLLFEGLSFRYATAFAGQPIHGYVSPTFASAMAKFGHAAGSQFPLNVKSFILAGRYLNSHYFGVVGARIAGLRRYATAAYDSLLASCDMLAMPTTPLKPPKVDRGTTYEEAHLLSGRGGGAEFALVAQNTWPFNLTGHPAITIPCAISHGLPIGLQLVGRHTHDATLMQAANAYQQSVEWERLTIPTHHS